jgi:hypothetical protein
VIIVLVHLDDSKIQQHCDRWHNPEVVGLELGLVHAWNTENLDLVTNLVNVLVQYFEWCWDLLIFTNAFGWLSKLGEVFKHLLEAKLVEELLPTECWWVVFIHCP